MITTFSFSEAGGHTGNEDALRICRHPVDCCCMCAVADGQGGRAGGRRAARLAVRSAVEAGCAREPARLACAATWPPLLRRADLLVSSACDAGFTTLVAFAVFGDRVAGASSGDSAALAVTEIEHHLLTERQAKNPPVGSGAASFVAFARDLSAPWKALAMTDGVWKYVGRQRIVELASALRGEELIETLCEEARLPGSGMLRDDFTVVLAEADLERR